MMVKKFDEYVESLDEAMNVEGLEKSKKTLAQSFDWFKSHGYKYLGKFFWNYKSYNAFMDEKIEKFLENNLHPIEKEIFGKIRTYLNADVWHTVPKYYDSYKNGVVDKYGESRGGAINKQREDELNKFFENTDSLENINKTSDKGETWYCFWNPTEKYYYLMTIQRRSSDLERAFNMYTCLKTEGVEKLKEHFIEEKEREEIEAREREERRKEYQAIEDKKNWVRDFEKSILDDYRKNPDNYKETTYSKLPKEIKDQLDISDRLKQYDECEYFETGVEHEINRGYSIETTWYVNNRDMTDGYVYRTERSSRRYMGD